MQKILLHFPECWQDARPVAKRGFFLHPITREPRDYTTSKDEMSNWKGTSQVCVWVTHGASGDLRAGLPGDRWKRPVMSNQRNQDCK